MADEAQNKKAEAQDMGFGITAETKDSNSFSMLPPTKIEANKLFPTGYKFPVGHLVNVIAKDNFDTKNGKTQVVQFVFKDSKGRQYVHTEWAQDPTDGKYQKKMGGLNSRVKHMYMQIFTAFPEKGIGVGINVFIDYFTAIANAFKAKEDLSKIPFFLKLTYYNGNLGFPLSPNFLQRVTEGQPCKLEVNLKYDTIEQEAQAEATIPGMPSGSGDDIDFDNDYN